MEIAQATGVPTGTPIRKTEKKGVLTFGRLYKADYQKEGTLTAEIRQSVVTTSYYPSKKVESSLQQNVFGLAEFGFTEQEFTSTEQRVAWLLVPANLEEAVVKAKVEAAANTGGHIYKALSNAPILDENQNYAISVQLKTLDDFANSQIVRYPTNEETVAKGTAGKIILDGNDFPQYRRTFFWTVAKDDVDLRTKDATKVYLSPQIKAELQGASILEGQLS